MISGSSRWTRALSNGRAATAILAGLLVPSRARGLVSRRSISPLLWTFSDSWLKSSFDTRRGASKEIFTGAPRGHGYPKCPCEAH
jgi:hypothetical protein